MMLLRALLAAALAFLPLAEASAGSGTITTKDASGTTRTFVVTTDGSGNFVGQTVLCDGTAAANCAAVSAGGAVKVDGSAATQPVSGTVTAAQATASSLNATVVGTGTFAVQAAQSGTYTVGISAAQTLATVTTVGTVTTLTGGGVASGSADSGNPIKVGCKYNATPVTLTDGNRGDCQADVNGYLKVNVASATGLAQGSTTSGQTGSLVMGAVTTAAPSYTNAQTSPISLTTAGAQRHDQYSWAGTVLGTPTNFGTTPGAVVAAGVNASHFLGTVAASAGTGNSGTGVQRVVIATDQPAFTNAVPVISGGSAYETVAASQTGQALGATGGTGDYLSHCVIYPTTTTPGVVTVFDNTNAAGTNVIAFPGGASSVSNLAPIAVPVGAISTGGAWKVTTGANVVVTCYGKFT